jgi:hypothetical protein
MGLSVGANQPWGSVAGITVDTWNTCQYCNCKEGHLHDKFCPTQLRLREDDPAAQPMEMSEETLRQIIKELKLSEFRPTRLRWVDNPADEPSCPTCKDGVCQCGPDDDPCPTCLYNVCQCGPDVDEGTEEFRSVFVKPEYSDLFEVLRDALEEAQEGKGAVRHGNGLSFMDQPALTITRAVGLGFPLGQAMKKIQESQRMDTDAAKRELLGAINYLAAAVLFLDE